MIKHLFLKTISFVFLITLSITSISYAWNKPTHMLIGAIAYKELKASNPKQLAYIISLLKKHPEYESRWLKQMNNMKLSKEEQDLFLFMQAARWPDDVRKGENDYHQPKWHYINYPYKPSDSNHKDRFDTNGENIITAYQKNIEILKSNATDPEKAVALCWIFHLVGDIHQPLHTSSYVSGLFPKGDKGGNSFKIRVEEGSKTISLHYLWDGFVLGSDNFQTVNNIATQLRNDIQRTGVGEQKDDFFFEWSKESFQLAKEKGYQNGKLEASKDDNDGTVLPKGYTATGKTVSQKQVALAGYRLADVLGVSL